MRDYFPRVGKILEELQPVLHMHGLQVFNCNRESGLRAFPFANIDTVLEEAA